MVLGRLPLISMCILALVCCSFAEETATTSKATASKDKVRKPVVMRHLKFDPTLPQTGLFEAMDEEKVSVRLVAKSEFEGHLLVENKTDAPLTIKMPEAFVGVQVLAQFGQGGGGQGGFGQQGGQGQGQGGQNQALGGGGQGGQQGGFGQQGGQGQGGGGGFFSIPVATVAKVPVNMLCLEHGKRVPSQRLHYTIVPPEKYTSDPRVHEICKMVGTGRLDRASAQAAAWHIANNMSWEQLANKMYNNVGSPDTPYFTRNQLLAAQSIVAGADYRVAELKKNGSLPETSTTTTPSSSSTASQK
jgi:hypothetical protein